MNRLIPWFAVLLLSLDASSTAAAQEPPVSDDVASPAATDPAALQTQLDEVKARLAALPSETGPDSPDGRRRTALEKRLTLLTDWLQAMTRKAEYNRLAGEIDERRAQVRTRLERLENVAEPAPPTAPTSDGLEERQAALEQKRRATSEARQAVDENQRRLEAIQGELSQSRSLAEEAGRLAPGFEAQAQAATDATERELLLERAQNSRLEQRFAGDRVESLRAEESLRKAQEAVLASESDAASRELEIQESEVALYAQAVTEQLEREQQAKQLEVTRREQEAERAATPPARFLAEREAELARSERNQSELQSFLVTLANEAADQDKRLQAEKEELAQLKEFVERSGLTGRSGERIKEQHERLPMRRRALERLVRSGLSERLAELRARRFEIEDLLYALNDTWPTQRAEIAAQLGPAEAGSFEDAVSELRERYRGTLRDERSLITEVVALGPTLTKRLLDRMDNLDALRRFLLSQLFQVRDGAPLGLALLRPLPDELRQIGRWATGLPASRAAIAESLRGPQAIALGLLLFPVLPIALFWLRQVLRRLVRRLNQRTIDRNGRSWDSTLAIGGGVVAAALLPAYLFAASRIVALAGLPQSVGPVLAEILLQFALILFTWLLARSFFSGRPIAHVQMDMDLDAEHTLYRGLRLLLLGWLLLLLPWGVLRDAPFGLIALPRLVYIAFFVLCVVAVGVALRPRSPLVRRAIASRSDSFAARFWPAIFALVIVPLIAVIGLDSTGYRFGAQKLAQAIGLSLLVILLLPALHHWVQQIVSGIARQRALRRAAAAGDEEPIDMVATGNQVQRFVRALFVLTGIVLLAQFWGVDEQAIKALDEVHVYGIRGADGEQEYVSAADLILFGIILISTVWFLKLLPGIFELLLFPRFRLDAGLRYAIITISQYMLFVIGGIMAFSAIHLDLGRLGWLIAAMGVGLGFGLQEIVSNFVSGLILLLERPIRVGDLVSLGTTSGTIKKINIRATTLVNFDQQEVIVPNRQFITAEVTNWTGSNRILRLVLPIGVAYGTDVDAVAAALDEIIGRQPEVLEEPAPAVLFLRHGESSLDFEVRVFVSDPSQKMPLTDRLNKEINKEFNRLGFEIPFPQRDLHIRSAPEGTFGSRAGADDQVPSAAREPDEDRTASSPTG